jgi:hypothetical protein
VHDKEQLLVGGDVLLAIIIFGKRIHSTGVQVLNSARL